MVVSKDLKPMKEVSVGREATMKTSLGWHPMNNPLVLPTVTTVHGGFASDHAKGSVSSSQICIKNKVHVVSVSSPCELDDKWLQMLAVGKWFT